MDGQSDLGVGELSPRTNRLLAAALDSALAALFPLLGVLGGFSWIAGVLLKAQQTGAPPLPAARPGGAVGALLAGSLLATLLLALYQLYALATRGQTLGKQLLGMQIVDEHDRPAGFVRAVLLRSWVFGLGVSAVQAFTGGLGAILPLVDVLFIFGDRRRCLHDHLAGTWVRDCSLPARRALPALAVVGAAAVGLGALLASVGVDLPASQLQALARKAANGSLRQPFAGARGWLPSDPTAPPERAPQPTGPGAKGDVHLSPRRTGKIYRYEDDRGTVQFSDELEGIPKRYRARAKAIE